MMGHVMDHVGRYRLDERIGTGAFAAVWRGHDTEFDLPVAVKILAEHWMHDLDVRRRFVAEARLLRQIAHERIVRVHDIGTVDGVSEGQPYFVMDYADGGTMADLVKTPLPAPESLALCVQAARGIQALHDHGHLHRDVKPANLLLDSGPQGRRVLIGDLGLAKALSELSGITVTAGSPAYMAPEQAGSAGGFDRRADVYGVGAVTYAVLAGRPPFQGASGLSEVAMRHPALRPSPIADLLGIDAGVDDLLRRTLAFAPDERPPTAGAFADELEAIVGGRTMRIDAVEAVTPPSAGRGSSHATVVAPETTDEDPTAAYHGLFRDEYPDLPASPAVRTSSVPETSVPRGAQPTYRSIADFEGRRGESAVGSVLLVLLVFALATAVAWLAWRMFG